MTNNAILNMIAKHAKFMSWKAAFRSKVESPLSTILLTINIFNKYVASRSLPFSKDRNFAYSISNQK